MNDSSMFINQPYLKHEFFSIGTPIKVGGMRFCACLCRCHVYKLHNKTYIYSTGIQSNKPTMYFKQTKKAQSYSD